MPQEDAPGDDADFGDDAATAAPVAVQAVPQRSMPDYGDIVDGDDEKETKPKIDVKSEPGASGNIAPSEVFESKKLPDFLRVDWISDRDVVVVFLSDEDAAIALKAAEEGFRDVDDKGSPGPGLWRAMRGMLDFRQATTGDEPEFGWKKQHRGGRQVRDFRMWTALTEMDKQILAREDEEQEMWKRPAPPCADEDDQPKKKRARVKREEDESVDLLQKMASQDKRILVKQEEKGELDPLPEIPEEKENEDDWQQDDWYPAEQSRKRGRGFNDTWGHDDRAGWQNDEYRPWDKQKGGKEKGKGKGGKRRNKDGDDNRESRKGQGRGKDAAGAIGSGVDATAEELEKRALRNQRFASKSQSLQEPKKEN